MQDFLLAIVQIYFSHISSCSLGEVVVFVFVVAVVVEVFCFLYTCVLGNFMLSLFLALCFLFSKRSATTSTCMACDL